MLRIGLTGGIGCGKTTVADLFAAKGVPVLDADQIAHDLVEPGRPALAAIVSAFGEDFLKAGCLNRAKLRQIVFRFPERRRQLESILHPMIFDALRRQLETLHSDYCIVCIPLLIETKQQAFVDRILVVDCPEALQYMRVIQRDGHEQSELGRMIRAQASREERLAAATDVIDNGGGIEQLAEQVDKLHQLYVTLAWS